MIRERRLLTTYTFGEEQFNDNVQRVSPRATVCGGVDCAHLQRHGPAAGLEGVLIGRGNAAGLVRDVEPRHLGGVPGQLVVVRRDYGGHVRLHAVPFAKLLLLHDLVLDVDDGGLRWEVRVGVVPSDAPTHTSSSSAQIVKGNA